MMPRFYFHLRDDIDDILDPDGAELPDLEAAIHAALAAARDTLSHELRAGRLNLCYRIDVVEEDGQVVHALPLGAAFDVITPAGRRRGTEIHILLPS